MKIACSAPAPGARRWPFGGARHDVLLWARDAAQAAAMQARALQPRYLPEWRCRTAARRRPTWQPALAMAATA
jgi:glycerol-3-phosphate dehydrogenase